MLTKKECEEALTEIEYSLCELEETKTGVVVNCLFDENLEIVKQLYKEHFSNPPLKWEELKEKTWYWHEPSKSWIYLFKPLNWEPVKGLRYAERIIHNPYDGYYMDFKEGQLYRKEVKE